MLPDQLSLSLIPDDPPSFDWEPSDDEIACALELNTLSTFRSQFRRLKTGLRSFKSMLTAPVDALDMFPPDAFHFRDRFIQNRASLVIGTEYKRLPKNVDVITFFDKRYPAQLRDLHSPPPLLFIRGDISFDYKTSLAIVGSRAYSDYGRQMSELFSYQLSSWGFTIVSGGARGIDSIAHQASIKSGGKTLAILGCGIDVVFPAENKKLFDEIAEHGALVTEFSVGTIPEKFNFPLRNRIIAAMSRGTLVIEAPIKSGALITADLALQTNREVFAVPGRLNDMRSKGTNMLIRDGAHPALDPTDIPLRYGLIVIEDPAQDNAQAASQLQGDEALVYAAVGLEAKAVDDLIREIGLPAPRILSTLLILQTRGMVRELSGSRFVRPVGPSRQPKNF
jgi:DNA processing protein